MKTKKCSKCGEVKPVSEFHKNKREKDGYCVWCKECVSKYQKAYRENNAEKIKKWQKEYYEKNAEKLKENSVNWNKNNIDKHKARSKRWTKNNPKRRKELTKKYRENHRKELREKNKKYRKDNPEKSRESQRKYLNNKNKRDPKSRLRNSVRAAIWALIKSNKNGRHWEDIVGYTREDLIKHLESQFKDGMSWENYGKKGWTIDHIRPISSFNFISCNDKEFKECWSLNNLQPLWAEENLSKSNKII
jgi:hypothetical protein